MARAYRYTWPRRFFNALAQAALKWGIGPSESRLLTVRGRTSGREYTTPVNVIDHDGHSYVVSPYGERQWVKNARAAREVRLARGKRQETRLIQELAAQEAAPVLAAYWRKNWVTRPFFSARPDDEEAFAREVARHPVFRLQ
jgi:deazaflavin-dependent oxidoreductase (nitroreductase family)